MWIYTALTVIIRLLLILVFCNFLAGHLRRLLVQILFNARSPRWRCRWLVRFQNLLRGRLPWRWRIILFPELILSFLDFRLFYILRWRLLTISIISSFWRKRLARWSAFLRASLTTVKKFWFYFWWGSSVGQTSLVVLNVWLTLWFHNLRLLY